jgi:hypothetical protein
VVAVDDADLRQAAATIPRPALPSSATALRRLTTLADLILERLSISAPPGRHFEGILVERGGTDWLMLFLTERPSAGGGKTSKKPRHERRSGPVSR